MNARRLTSSIPIVLLALFFAGYVLYPVSMTLAESLRVDGSFSFAHYLNLLDPTKTGNIDAVWNSVYVSLLSVLCSCVVGVFLAVVLTQVQFPLRTVASRIAIVPIALPPLVGVISFLFVFGESGILPRVLQAMFHASHVPFFLDGIPAIVVVHAFSFHVYYYLFVSSALRQLDGSILEAAANLGSTPWNTFRKVILPELRPALVGASILTFMASMASFTAPLIFAGGKRFITLAIYTTKLNGELDLAAAQSMLLLLLSVIFYAFLHFSGGSRGALRRTKGAVRARFMEIGRTTRIVALVVALALLVFELFPFLTIVLISFAREGSWTEQIVPSAYTLDNYRRLFTEPHVLAPILNSLLMGLITVGGALLIGVSSAYLVTKGSLRRVGGFFDLLFMLPYAIPGTVVAISLIIAFNHPTLFNGYTVLVGTFWILPLAYVVREYPVVVRATGAALEQLDDSLLEAGATFGAGVLRRLTKIALPIILPGIISGCVLTMIAALGEFVSSILLYTYSSRPISVEILSQLRTFDFGLAAAYSVVLLCLILLVIALAGALGGKKALKDEGFAIESTAN